MPLRALRLFTVPTSSEATLAASLSFASTLQLAAGQAWSRRVVAHAPVVNARKRGTRCQIPSKPSKWEISTQRGPSSIGNSGVPLKFPNSVLKDCSKRVNPTESLTCFGQSAKLHTKAVQRSVNTKSHDMQLDRRRPPCGRQRENNNGFLTPPRPIPKVKKPSVNVTYFDPQLNDYELPPADLSDPDPDPHDFFYDITPEVMPEVLASVSAEPLDLRPSYLITPTSRSSLYRNLLYLVNIRRPSARLPALLDYHSRYPDYHSTRSYNLLIDLSIHHRQYGVTDRLLCTLRRTSIPQNIETYKLQVRLLVHQGLWDSAWSYVRSLQTQNKVPRDGNGRPDIPLPIWLELCRAPRKRRKLHSTHSGDDNEKSPEVLFDPTIFQAQRQVVNANKPANLPTLPNTSPYAVYCIVQLMMRAGDRASALALTQAYFKAIPRSLGNSKMLGCLRIIHIHMAFSTAKKGLPKFYDARRRLISLLKLHPSLRPTSRTVFLLLSMLRRSKKCGTVAWKQLAIFKSKWGRHVEDRRVQRRVSQLALKEGRMDIVEKIRRVERPARFHRQRRLLEQRMVDGLKWVPERKFVRYPLRQVYPKNGMEARLWHRLRGSIRRKLARRRAARNDAISRHRTTPSKPHFVLR